MLPFLIDRIIISSLSFLFKTPWGTESIVVAGLSIKVTQLCVSLMTFHKYKTHNHTKYIMILPDPTTNK